MNGICFISDKITLHFKISVNIHFNYGKTDMVF